MVSRLFARKREPHVATLRDDHHAALLRIVALQPTLAGSVFQRAKQMQRRSRVHVVQATVLPTGDLKRPLGVVREDGRVDPDVLTKELRLFWRAAADDEKLRAAPPDLWKFVAQLRDLLAAENSTEVPHPDDHGVAVGPKRVEPYRATAVVAHFDGGK